MANINQRLNGLNPLSYLGDNAVQPPEFVTVPRPPTPDDSRNFYLGTIWLDISNYPMTLPAAKDVWMLVALVANQATWVHFGSGSLETLTGNSGGPVSPDVNDNINVVGDGITIDVVGTPINNTLTISLIGGGGFANSFPTDNGTATPIAGVLNIIANVAALNCGSSVLFDAPGPSNTVQLNVTDSDANTIIGFHAGNLTFTATNCTGLGEGVLASLTSSSNNTVVGTGSAPLLAGGAGSNTIIGQGAAIALVSGNSSIIIGQGAGSNLTGVESNSILINDPGVTGLDSFFALHMPVLIGNGFDMHNYPGGNASNGSNVFIGFNCGNRTMANTAVSNYTLGENCLSALTTGGGNCVMGNQSGGHITSGVGNVLLGTSAADTLVGGLITGNQNVAIGYTAGASWNGAESFNIAISTIGFTGESLTTRIGGFQGGENIQTKCFIQGIRGITTVNNDAVACLIDSAGQLGTVSSSARYKDNIDDIGADSNVLHKLRPVVFNYKKHAPEHKNFGLIAEEVAVVAPRLVVYDKDGIPETVRYDQLTPLLLNELQRHGKALDDRDRVIAELLDRVAILEERVIFGKN